MPPPIGLPCPHDSVPIYHGTYQDLAVTFLLPCSDNELYTTGSLRNRIRNDREYDRSNLYTLFGLQADWLLESLFTKSFQAQSSNSNAGIWVRLHLDRCGYLGHSYAHGFPAAVISEGEDYSRHYLFVRRGVSIAPSETSSCFSVTNYRSSNAVLASPAVLDYGPSTSFKTILPRIAPVWWSMHGQCKFL